MKQPSSASPNAIIMVGIPGAGKSAFAEHFAETFQAPIINSGALQQELELNNTQADWLQAIVLNEFMKTRRTILVDVPLSTKEQRVALLRTVIKADYRPLLVWVQTDPLEARRRAVKKYPVGSGLTPEEFEYAFKHFEPPTAKEKAIVISGKHTFTTQLKIVLKQIAIASERQVAAPRSTAVKAAPRQDDASQRTPKPKSRGITIQ